MVKFSKLTLALVPAGAFAQTLTEVLTGTPDLSAIAGVLGERLGALQPLLPTTGITLLAPSNEAVRKFQRENGMISELDQTLVLNLLSYHVLNGTLKATDLNEKEGVSGQTLLKAPEYAILDGEGQRLYCSQYGSTGVGTQGALKVYSGIGAAASVSNSDLEFNGGVVHVIDTVLNLPLKTSETADEANLNILVEALTKTNLVETVDETPKFTVFAPTDEAFRAAGVNVADTKAEDLAAVLKKHTIMGTAAYSSDLEDGQEVKALDNAQLTISKRDGKLYVEDIEIIQANVVTANGVVHVINGVIGVENKDATPTNDDGSPVQTSDPESSAARLGASLGLAGLAGLALSFFF